MGRRRRTLLIVSPHPDDAAISLGASILRYASVDTTVWNVFSCQSYSLIERDPQAARRQILQEEHDASAALGTRVIMGGFPEAELRGYARLSQRMGHDESAILSRPAEYGVLERVTTELRRLLDDLRPTFVGLPLGVGGHIDHLLGREAALACLAGTRTWRTTFFYEDLPYALNRTWVGRPLAALGARGVTLVERRLDVAPFVEQKQRVLEIYRSQLSPRDVRMLTAYCRELGGGGGAERIWTASGATCPPVTGAHD